jgi:hypothetical protein
MNSVDVTDNKQTPKQEPGHLQRIGTANSLFLGRTLWKRLLQELQRALPVLLLSIDRPHWANDTNRQLTAQFTF